MWASTADAGTASSFPREAKEAGRWSLLVASVGLLFVLPFALLLELVVRLFTGKPWRAGRAGRAHAYDAQVKVGLQAQYALLIGGPLGAAILAKGIVTSQVTKGQSKPDSRTGAKHQT
jgi:hypothetical protein